MRGKFLIKRNVWNENNGKHTALELNESQQNTSRDLHSRSHYTCFSPRAADSWISCPTRVGLCPKLMSPFHPGTLKLRGTNPIPVSTLLFAKGLLVFLSTIAAFTKKDVAESNTEAEQHVSTHSSLLIVSTEGDATDNVNKDTHTHTCGTSSSGHSQEDARALPSLQASLHSHPSLALKRALHTAAMLLLRAWQASSKRLWKAAGVPVTAVCTKLELRLHHPCLLVFIAEQQELALDCFKASLSQCC